MRLGRARHHRRIPLPGRLCCDPARSTSTCCRSHEASAGGPSCACVNRYFHDRADDGHIGLPAAVPSRQSHTREPTVPSGTARKSQIAITASPIRPHQNLQIPITSHLCPAGSCLGGFRTPAPCLSLDLRGPASENLHHLRQSGWSELLSKPVIRSTWRRGAFWLDAQILGWSRNILTRYRHSQGERIVLAGSDCWELSKKSGMPPGGV